MFKNGLKKSSIDTVISSRLTSKGKFKDTIKMDTGLRLTTKENTRNLIRMETKFNYLWDHIMLKMSKDSTKKMVKSMISEVIK